MTRVSAPPWARRLVNGRIAGYVRIFARTMLVRGEPVAAGGIGSVATEAARATVASPPRYWGTRSR